MVYVLITSVVLLFLNIYCSNTSQKMIYSSKKESLVERCQLAANEIAQLDVLNTSTATQAISQLGSLRVSRLVITDQNGLVVYDTSEDSAKGKYALFPEIVKALDGTGYDVFSWHYENGTTRSQATVPVISYGTVIGCVYMTEYDTDQGILLLSLQRNILYITIILELVVFIFSMIYSKTFSKRLSRITNSIRVIRKGDYSHKLVLRGKDELSFLADEFNDLTQRLQDSERKRTQFVSDASHELKTPLASVKLLSDTILQNDMDPETVREFVEDIGKEADRLTRMTQKLLSLSRIETQEDGDCEIVNIAPTAYRVVHMIAPIAKKNQISIKTDLQEHCPILILEDDLYQIIFNLVENGIKYNTTGGSLMINLRREDDNAVLQVTDTGVGIPYDAQEHIFERFYRVDKARSRESGGSGLGLAIVRNMVERNNGTIKVESVYGKGSTFTVEFPIFDTEDEEAEE